MQKSDLGNEQTAPHWTNVGITPNYSVEWEMLNQEMTAACKAYAINLARVNEHDRNSRIAVSNAEKYYQHKTDKAKEFILKITELKMQK